MDHLRNRTVFAFTGTREALFEGGIILYEEAFEENRHAQTPGSVSPHRSSRRLSVCAAQRNQYRGNHRDVRGSSPRRSSSGLTCPSIFSGNPPVSATGVTSRISAKGNTRVSPKRSRIPAGNRDFGPDTFPPRFRRHHYRCPASPHQFQGPCSTREPETWPGPSATGSNLPEAGLRHVKANSGVDSDTGLPFITVAIHNFQHTPMYRVIECIRMEGPPFRSGNPKGRNDRSHPRNRLHRSRRILHGYPGF